MTENELREYQRRKEPSVDAAALCFAALALMVAAGIIVELLQHLQ